MLTLNASRTPRLVIASVLALPLLVSGCWFAAAGGVAAAGGGGGGGGGGVVNLAPTATLADPGRLDQPEEQLTFTVADGNNDLVDLDVSFQLQGGGVTPATLTGATVVTPSAITASGTATVAPAVISVAGNVVTGIPATAAGVEVVVTWALGTDVNLNVASPGPSLIFGVTDGKVVVEPVVQQDDGSVIGNDAPTVANVTTSGNTGNIVVSAEVADSTDDEITLVVEFSTDDFATVTSATIVVGATAGLAAPITSTTHTVSWGSSSDLNLVNLANVKVRVTALDATAQGSAESAAFTVINNQPPTATIGNLNTRLPGNASGDILIPLTLANAEENAEAMSVGIEFSTDDFDLDIRSATILESTTGLITSLTGTQFAFTWDTDGDLGANALGGVRLRFQPTDSFQAGSTVVSQELDVLNDAPIVSIQSPPITDSTGNPLPSVGQVPIGFLLVDSSTGDRSSVSVEFSTDSFVLDIRSATLIGATNGLPGAPGGIPHAVAWNSLADLGFVNLASVSLRVTATDQFNAQSTPVSTSFELLNNDGPIVDIDPVGRQDGDFIINYTLFDEQNDVVDVDVKFNLADGTQFTATPAAANTEGITGLGASQFGQSHVFVWDSATDLGAGATEGITIVITPSDAQSTGQPDLSNAFTVGNDAPVIQNILTPAGDQSGNIAIQFQLADTTADSVDLFNVEFSTDSFVADIRSATLIGGNPNALATTATGLQQTVVWISDGVNQLPGERQESVQMRFRVRDAAGTPGAEDSILVATGTFVVDNNTPPTVTMSELALNADAIRTTTIEFTLFDTESDAVDAVLQWRVASEAFPALGAEFDDPTTRAAALADPVKRKQLQILSEQDRDFFGITDVTKDTLNANQLQVTSLGAIGLLSPGKLAGKTIAIARSRSPVQVAVFVSPTAISSRFDPAQGLVTEAFVALANGDLTRVTVATGQSQNLATGLGNVSDMEFSADGQSLLAVDSAGGRLLQIDLVSGASTTVVTGITNPTGVAVISSLQALVTDDNGAGDLLLVNLTAGTSAKIFSGLSTPRGIEISTDGRRAFIVEQGASRIVELDLNRLALTVIATGIASPNKLVLRPGGRNLLIASSQGGISTIQEFDLATRTIGLVVGGVDSPGGVSVTTDGSIFFIESILGGSLNVLDGVQQTRAITTVTTSPPRLEVDADFSPAVPAGTRFTIFRGLNPTVLSEDATLQLATSPTGVPHRFTWDAPFDAIPQLPIQVGVTPFDQSRGTQDASQLGVALERFDGTADVTFAPGTSVLSAPQGVALGDLDGDGDIDVISVNSGSVNATGFLQTSPGVFEDTPSIDLSISPAGSGPKAIALGDLDADGDLDIVTANFNSNNITGFLQTSAGTFEAVPSIVLSDPSTMSGPEHLTLADIDGDQDLDIVSANRNSDTVTAFRQITPGVFEALPSVVLQPNNITTMEEPRFVVVGDVDGDGDVDIVTSNDKSNTITVFRQTTPGVFEGTPSIVLNQATGFSVAFGSIDLADIDGDGLIDIVSKERNIAVYRQTAPGIFEISPSISVSGDGAGTLGLADLDGDGDLDFLDANFSDNSVLISLQESPGLFEAEASIVFNAGRVEQVVVGDVDGDGDQDVVSANSSDNEVTIFRQHNPGRLEASPSTNLNTGVNTFGVAVGDIDGDGLIDILGGAQQVRIHRQISPGNFETIPSTVLTTVFAPSVIAADLDADGDMDVAAVSNQSDELRIFLQANGALPTTASITLATGASQFNDPKKIVAADLNGDGLLDLISANSASDSVTGFLQTSAGIFEATPSIILQPGVATMDGTIDVAVADLNADGRLDIVTANKDSDNITGFLQIGTGIFEAVPSINLNPGIGTVNGPNSLALEDMDGDGDIDIVSVNGSSANLTIFLQTAPGVFEATPSIVIGGISISQTVANSLAVRDVDGDGDVDIVVADIGLSGVKIFRQTAPGNYEQSPGISLDAGAAITGGPQAVLIADLDGDGDAEVLVASQASDNVTVFSVTGR